MDNFIWHKFPDEIPPREEPENPQHPEWDYDSVKVLVTLKDNFYDRIEMAIMWYHIDPQDPKENEWQDSEGRYMIDCSVLAWAYLPSPYEEKEKDNGAND